ATTTWPRWGAYIGNPFALTSLGTLAVMAVPAWIEQRTEHWASRMHHRPGWLTGDNIHFATWLIAVPVLNLLIWALALKAANTLAHLRRNSLMDLMRKHSALAQNMENLSLWGAVKALPENLKEIPGEVRDAAVAELAQAREFGGQLD